MKKKRSVMDWAVEKIQYKKGQRYYCNRNDRGPKKNTELSRAEK